MKTSARDNHLSTKVKEKLMQKLTIERTGGQVLIDQLVLNDVDTVFAVPGESYLAALDALYGARNQINLITCRQEGGAAFMAEAFGKVTGKLGVCFVTRGPGACNASIAVHTAMQDSTPLVLFVGQVARGMSGREAFQEIDFSKMFAPPITKMAVQIDDPTRIPEVVHHALTTALSGRPGPVVVALPEDMLTEKCAVDDGLRAKTVRPRANAQQLSQVRTALEKSSRPLMILGGSGWSPKACSDIKKFAVANMLPTAVSFRRQDLFDNYDELYVGDLSTGVDPSLTKRIKCADLLLVIGARLGEITTQGYTAIKTPVPDVAMIHVYAEATEFGKVFQPETAILSGMDSFAEEASTMPAIDNIGWKDWAKDARQDYLKTLNPDEVTGPLDLAFVVNHLQQKLPKNTIVTVDAGNFSGWAHRFWRFKNPQTELGPTAGAMGYSVPAGVAAQIAKPNQQVISFVGDGGFMMTGQELATALQHGAKPIILLFNNNMYGTIRMHQERNYPERVIGTDLVNPDFKALALAYGAHGERVTKNEEFGPALTRALGANKAALIELITDPEQINTRTTISKLRAHAQSQKLT